MLHCTIFPLTPCVFDLMLRCTMNGVGIPPFFNICKGDTYGRQEDDD